MVKTPPAMQETWIQFLGCEDPLEEGIATHSSILAWRLSMDRGAWWATVHVVAELEMTEQLSTALCTYREEALQPSSFLQKRKKCWS